MGSHAIDLGTDLVLQPLTDAPPLGPSVPVQHQIGHRPQWPFRNEGEVGCGYHHDSPSSTHWSTGATSAATVTVSNKDVADRSLPGVAAASSASSAWRGGSAGGTTSSRSFGHAEPCAMLRSIRWVSSRGKQPTFR